MISNGIIENLRNNILEKYSSELCLRHTIICTNTVAIQQHLVAYWVGSLETMQHHYYITMEICMNIYIFYMHMYIEFNEYRWIAFKIWN